MSPGTRGQGAADSTRAPLQVNTRQLESEKTEQGTTGPATDKAVTAENECPITSRKGSIQPRALLAGTVNIVAYPAAGQSVKAEAETTRAAVAGHPNGPNAMTHAQGRDRHRSPLQHQCYSSDRRTATPLCYQSIEHMVVDLECRELRRGTAIVAAAFRGRVVVVILRVAAAVLAVAGCESREPAVAVEVPADADVVLEAALVGAEPPPRDARQIGRAHV